MKTIITIIKKELKRVFTDPKLVFSVLILPGLLIFLLYSIMGSAIEKELMSTSTKEIHLKNGPVEYIEILNNLEITYQITNLDNNILEKQILDEEIFIVIIFDLDFENKVINDEIPNIEIIYSNIHNETVEYIKVIEQTLSLLTIELNETYHLFNINKTDQTDNIKLVAKTISMLLPFLMTTFLFQGAMSIGPESIAGDKERGTIQTLLSTPTKRRDIAIGKIISLSILTILSALSNFVGVIFSITKITNLGSSINISDIYKTNTFVNLFFITTATVLLITSITAVLSALAKNVKEASLISMPVMFISMIIGITSMYSNGSSNPRYIYFIPLYNSVMLFKDIFMLNASSINIIIGISSNLLVFVLLVFVLTKQFESEKIMFKK